MLHHISPGSLNTLIEQLRLLAPPIKPKKVFPHSTTNLLAYSLLDGQECFVFGPTNSRWKPKVLVMDKTSQMSTVKQFSFHLLVGTPLAKTKLDFARLTLPRNLS